MPKYRNCLYCQPRQANCRAGSEATNRAAGQSNLSSQIGDLTCINLKIACLYYLFHFIMVPGAHEPPKAAHAFLLVLRSFVLAHELVSYSVSVLDNTAISFKMFFSAFSSYFLWNTSVQ